MNRQQHPFSEYRGVMVATKRPLSKILGTKAAARREKSKPHIRGHETRRADANPAIDPVALARSMRPHVGLAS